MRVHSRVELRDRVALVLLGPNDHAERHQRRRRRRRMVVVVVARRRSGRSGGGQPARSVVVVRRPRPRRESGGRTLFGVVSSRQRRRRRRATVLDGGQRTSRGDDRCPLMTTKRSAVRATGRVRSSRVRRRLRGRDGDHVGESVRRNRYAQLGEDERNEHPTSLKREEFVGKLR